MIHQSALGDYLTYLSNDLFFCLAIVGETRLFEKEQARCFGWKGYLGSRRYEQAQSRGPRGKVPLEEFSDDARRGGLDTEKRWSDGEAGAKSWTTDCPVSARASDHLNLPREIDRSISGHTGSRGTAVCARETNFRARKHAAAASRRNKSSEHRRGTTSVQPFSAVASCSCCAPPERRNASNK